MRMHCIGLNFTVFIVYEMPFVRLVTSTGCYGYSWIINYTNKVVSVASGLDNLRAGGKYYTLIMPIHWKVLG